MLLEPYRFERVGIVAHNRIMLAALTNTQSHADGRVGDDEIAWLAARARGGFGTITTCASHVQRQGQGFKGQLGVFSDELKDGLWRLSQPLSEQGAVSLVQIYHGGIRAYYAPDELPIVGPSAAATERHGKPYTAEAMTEEQIAETIKAFAAAAKRSYRSGFTGVEIHGAHGYLLTQFLSTKYNTRTDGYGGDAEGRARFPREVFAAVKGAIAKTCLVCVRLSPQAYGQEPDEVLALAQQLVAEGADIIHISLKSYDQTFSSGSHQGEGILSTYRAQLGPDVAIAVAGGIVTAEDGERALSLGADFCALGKIAIGNPEWPKLVASREQPPILPPYTPAFLRDRQVGPDFVQYLRKFQGFLSDES